MAIGIAKVRFLGHLRTQLGLSEINVEVVGNETLTSFLKKLSNLFPSLRDIIKSVIEFRGEYLLLLNDVDVNVYGELDKVVVKDCDILTIVPIVHGGRT